jgi:hypothetical protein
MVEWHDQCVHLSDLHASWLTYIVMIIGELCNFTGAQSTYTVSSELRLLITFSKAYAFVEALVVVRHPLFITFVC